MSVAEELDDNRRSSTTTGPLPTSSTNARGPKSFSGKKKKPRQPQPEVPLEPDKREARHLKKRKALRRFRHGDEDADLHLRRHQQQVRE